MQGRNAAGNMQSVQLNYKGIFLAAVGVAGALYLLYSAGFGQSSNRKVFTQGNSASWKTAEPVEVPESVKQKAKEIKIQERTLTFTSDNKKVEVFTRIAEPEGGTAKLNVLLLHGAAFSSKTWLELGTLGFIAAMGHKAVAVDLPGFGQTKSKVVNRRQFLVDFIKESKLDHPIIISPSMSGSFSIPYLMTPEASSCQDRAMAYIPVAPTNTDSVEKADYKECKRFAIFFQEALPRDGRTHDVPVLLLHGAYSDSQAWTRNNDLGLLAAMGHHAIAVDLPGWGKSKNNEHLTTAEGRVHFITSFLKQQKVDRPVIVAASMSGGYAIPYMMSPKADSCESRMRGFVALAPVQTSKYSHAQYHRCEIPTMIVYGSKDVSLGLESVGNLRNMRRSEIFTMEGAGHACYEERPAEWHKYLYNFMLGVQRDQD